MVAPFLKASIIILCVASFSCVAWSKDRAVSRDSSSAILGQLARVRLARATVALKQRMSVCRRREKVIPPSQLVEVKLTDSELRLALQYFSVKASNDCLQDAAGQFVIAVRIAERAEVLSDRIEGVEGKSGVAQLVLYSVWREIKLRAQYSKLPRGARADLEKIEMLKDPFALLETVEAAGLL